MRSMQWRLLSMLCCVIALAWCISLSMSVTYLIVGPDIGWRVELHAMGDALARHLPAAWFGSPGTARDAARPGLLPSRTQPAEIGAMLTAMLLNTVELVVMGLLLWRAVVTALRPLRSTSESLSSRRAFDLSPVPVEALPTELQPLLQSFNAMLVRLDSAMQMERQFIADAAHELRTPLAALHLQAEVALAAGTLQGKDQALGKLIDVSLRTHRLAEQLLDTARLEAGLHRCGREPLDLLVVCRMIIDDFWIQAARRDCRLDLDGSACLLTCDPDEIGILIRNLVDNAIRHGHVGGRVRLRCGYLRRGDLLHPMLEIEDDGPGVAAEERQAIFTRFHRAGGASGRGSGIGLSLVAAIAENHEATIETGCGPGWKGFRLRVVFPSQLGGQG
ncbi:signal transduction histidine kinase [Frateuria aurantia DSM 6220]|uniref:histidine kinase n=2 Tax=Frateuria aurantia TaxID=81475 RepID=H8L4Y5_FRAAD|nr:signal transduction histidine kinase [Frateuria aurantia DSM 6220]